MSAGTRADAPSVRRRAARRAREVAAISDALRSALRRSREPRIARARARPARARRRRRLAGRHRRLRRRIPTSAWPLLRERCAHAVLGNHDLAAVENFGVEHFNDAARAAIAWTQTMLDEPSRAWLNALPYELRFPEFLLVHGAPVHYFEYILDKDAAAARVRAHRRADRLRRPHAHRGILGAARRMARSVTSTCSMAASSRSKPGSATSSTSAASASRAISIRKRSFAFYDPRAAGVEWIRYAYPIAEVQREDARRRPAAYPRRSSRGRADERTFRSTTETALRAGRTIPIGMHLQLRPRADGESVRAQRHARAAVPRLARHRARRHRDGAARRSDGARCRLCRTPRRHRGGQRALSPARSARVADRGARPR